MSESECRASASARASACAAASAAACASSATLLATPDALPPPGMDSTLALDRSVVKSLLARSARAKNSSMSLRSMTDVRFGRPPRPPPPSGFTSVVCRPASPVP